MAVIPIPLVIPAGCPFGPYNLPYGIFSTAAGHGLGVSPPDSSRSINPSEANTILVVI